MTFVLKSSDILKYAFFILSGEYLHAYTLDLCV